MELSIQERLKGLRLSNDMIDLLKSGRVDNSLLCERRTPIFPGSWLTLKSI